MADLIKTVEDDDEPEDLSEDSGSEDELQPTKKRVRGKHSGEFDPTFSFTQLGNDIWAEKLNSLTKVVKEAKPKHAPRTSLNEKIEKQNKKKKSKAVQAESESDEDEEDESVKEESSSADESDALESDDSISKMQGRKKGKKMLNGKGKKDNKKKLKEIEQDDDIDLSEDDLRQDEIRVRDKKIKGKKNKKTVEDDAEDEEDVERLEADASYAFETNISFQQMNLSRPLLKAVTTLGFVHPTPIQAAAIPIALAGRDICGCAATGTGKTAAYMLPVLERLLYKPKAHAVTRVLCLVPTRELGVQVYTVTKQLATFASDVEIGLAVGGLDIHAQEAILRKNPDIVIATPGRLIDHLGNTPSFSLDSIEILILDEADRMLDEWFADQLKEIVKQCSPRRQTLLFSATMTDRVKDLATVSLKNPTKIFVDSNKQVAFRLSQQFVKVRNESDREAILCSLVVRTFHSRTMVFVPTKKTAHRLHILLGLLGIRIAELHGDLSQSDRLNNLKKFQHSEVDVLIVTDVAARGLDIPGVQSVLNYTMPPALEQYIHRCGRTARAGQSGVAVSLVGEGDRKLMKQVAKSATLPVKARIIPPDNIVKYRDKIKSLEPDIEAVMKEEEAEKSIAKAEIEANRAMKMLEAKKAKKKKGKKAQQEEEEKKRVWFQSHKERMKGKERLKGMLGRPNADDRQAMADGEEERKLQKLTEFQARQAKRKRRVGPKATDSLGPAAGPAGQKRKRKSNFDDELTNTKKARQFRHQPKGPKTANKGPPNKAARKFGQKTGKFKRK